MLTAGARSVLARLSGLALGLAAFAIATPAHAQPTTNLLGSNGTLFDFYPDGAMSNGSVDSYDVCYGLSVGGMPYGAFGTPTLAGRTITFAPQTLSGLNVSRIAYVPAAGPEWARYAEVIENPTGAAISVDVTHTCNLGSDSSTVVTGSSDLDVIFETSDEWLTTNDGAGAGDPALGHVVQGPGRRASMTYASLLGDGLEWRTGVTVPAGGRVVVLFFAIQQYVPDDDALVRTEAMRLTTLPSDAVSGIESMLPDIVNFGFVPACTDGTACTDSRGTAGMCHFGSCCTGCWNGSACMAAGTPSACGIRGGACTNCLDATSCTVDTCIATTGTCFRVSASTGTSCDDGQYCTTTDACDGAGACVGTGSPCDDANACTADACVESTDSCTHPSVADGTTCVAGTPGICHVGVCCRGCWDGASCVSGTSGSACGVAGAACRSCADGDACSSDFCSLGACTNPPAPSGTVCDDGAFCTSVDRCDGADHCVGTGSACDDGTTCTTDVCSEATRSCDYAAVTSACIIGGTCYAAGVVDPSNPCAICDPARAGAAWSARTGTLCGAASCSGGVLSGAATCDATATCAPGTTIACPTGECMDATRCAAACADDADCPSGTFCEASGRCAPTRGAGETCTTDPECSVGACALDGVCCDTACDDVCSSCVLVGHEGVCTPYAAGSDPESECPEVCSGAASCGSLDGDAAMPDDTGVPEDAAAPDDGGTRMDGSVDPASDAGVDAGAAPAAPGGCCAVAGSGRPGAGAALLGLVLAWAITRRRRR